MAAEDGKNALLHCGLEINGGLLMMTDVFEEMGPFEPSDSFTMQLMVDGHRRLVETGGRTPAPKSLRRWQRCFGATGYGRLRDPFGGQLGYERSGQTGLKPARNRQRGENVMTDASKSGPGRPGRCGGSAWVMTGLVALFPADGHRS